MHLPCMLHVPSRTSSLSRQVPCVVWYPTIAIFRPLFPTGAPNFTGTTHVLISTPWRAPILSVRRSHPFRLLCRLRRCPPVVAYRSPQARRPSCSGPRLGPLLLSRCLRARPRRLRGLNPWYGRTSSSMVSILLLVSLRVSLRTPLSRDACWRCSSSFFVEHWSMESVHQKSRACGGRHLPPTGCMRRPGRFAMRTVSRLGYFSSICARPPLQVPYLR